MSRRTFRDALAVALVAWVVSGCGGSADTGEALCRQSCGLNHCPMDAPLETCVSACKMNHDKCPSEMEAALQCRVSLPAAQLVCGSSGVTEADSQGLATCGPKAVAAIQCLGV